MAPDGQTRSSNQCCVCVSCVCLVLFVVKFITITVTGNHVASLRGGEWWFPSSLREFPRSPTNCSHLGAPDPSPEHVMLPLLKLLSHREVRGQMPARLRFSHLSDFRVTRTRPPDIWRSDVAPDCYHPNHKELPDGGRPGL